MDCKKTYNYIVLQERMKENKKWIARVIFFIVIMIVAFCLCNAYLDEIKLHWLKNVAVIASNIAMVCATVLGTKMIIKKSVRSKEIKDKETALEMVGFVNVYGEAPPILNIEKKGFGTIYHLSSMYMPLTEYERNVDKIQNAWNVDVRKVSYEVDKQHVQIKTVDSQMIYPSKIYWKDEFLSDDDFVIKLGQGDFDEVSVNLDFLPHVLLASETGGGKSMMLNLILMQSYKKKALLGVVDFKGGMDYFFWQDKCSVITSYEDCYEYLINLEHIMEERRDLLLSAKVTNIKDYNEKAKKQLPRLIVVFDEVADILGVKKKSKAEKALFLSMEEKITMLVRKGRAFGIHIILCYQRPSNEVLSGDIKANLGIRICGKADRTMSHMVLDSYEATEMIPAEAKGCFVTNMGGFFKAYYYNPLENESFKDK